MSMHEGDLSAAERRARGRPWLIVMAMYGLLFAIQLGREVWQHPPTLHTYVTCLVVSIPNLMVLISLRYLPLAAFWSVYVIVMDQYVLPLLACYGSDPLHLLDFWTCRP